MVAFPTANFRGDTSELTRLSLAELNSSNRAFTRLMLKLSFKLSHDWSEAAFKCVRLNGKLRGKRIKGAFSNVTAFHNFLDGAKLFQAACIGYERSKLLHCGCVGESFTLQFRVLFSITSTSFRGLNRFLSKPYDAAIRAIAGRSQRQDQP